MLIEINENVIEYICQQTDVGYEYPYKQERIGFLFGRKNNKCVKITKAILYKGGIRTRTGIWVNTKRFKARGYKIASIIRNAWLGTYHSHVEEAGEFSYGLSEDDINTIIKDSKTVELIITIWATDISKRLNPGNKRLLAIERFGDTNYRYIISGYIKTPKGLRLVKVKKI